MKFSLYSLLACLAVMLLMPVSVSAQEDMEQKTIAQLASENGDLTILVAALNAADLAATLEGEGPFTVFAPTDEAFRALPQEVFQALLKAENRQALVDILTYHVANGALAASDVTAAIEGAENGEFMAGTMNGDFTASLMDGTVMLTDAKGNTANVIQADVMASNGVIHVIDAVLLPENLDVDALLAPAMEDAAAMTDDTMEAGEEAGEEVAEGAEEMVTEAAEETEEAMTEAGNEMQEAGQEVVEETEEAMTEAGHEVREAGQEVEQEMTETAQDVRRTTQEVGSDVTQMNREMGENMDEVDNTLMDSTDMDMDMDVDTDMDMDTDMERSDMDNGTMGNTTRRSMSPDNNTIVDVAAANTDFRTLVNAVETAELADVLASDGEFTVFAPTEAAFGKLESGTVEGLDKEQLQGVLTYHVVASKISAADLIKAIEANNGYFRIQTMGGGSLIASMQDGNVILTDGNGGVATVTSTDVEASNGTIHVIDTVLMPRM
ncbi:hypothetical protein LEM8419_02954 [Neolewinella maritima]|uniref:FAS1 domain-containing protein n=1 Tax=Neolewinella maritima TaxID=1383882 RepID=A0ABM9B3X3_9BACT|nr:fasciclin domain-containing protein [Neolewinella maritima]CAH1002039.1 hypothetical protein LEM8419_02954 [Neolewinella maritima]